MKVKLLKTAYITEDDNIFECSDLDKFAQVLKTIGTSASSEEAERILSEKGIPYKRYKVITTTSNRKE